MVSKIIKKTDPRHKSWKPPLGEQTLPVKQSFWLFHYKHLLVTAVKFDQKKDSFRDISVILEDGSEIPLEWVRRDRYGKPHQETTGYQKGIHYLLNHKGVRGMCPGTLIPGDLPVSVVDSTTLSRYNPGDYTPVGGFFWKELDCSMEKDPERASLSKLVAAEQGYWDQYRVYKSLVPTDQLTDLTFEGWEVLNKELWDAQHRRNCSRPNGTDGYRW